jgi:integrase
MLNPNKLLSSWSIFRQKRGGDPIAIAEDRQKLHLMFRRCKIPAKTGFSCMTQLMHRLPITEARLLLRFLRFWAHSTGKVPYLDATSLPFPRRSRRVARPLLNLLQIAAIRNACKSPSDAALVHLMSTYGHRPISLSALRCADLDFSQSPAWMSLGIKGGDRIRHPLTPESVRLLRPLWKNRPPSASLFTDSQGNPWNNERCRRAGRNRLPKHFARLIKKAGISATLQDLRRYAITTMLDRNFDLATIASITGHRCPHVLLRYAATNPARQIAAIDRLSSKPKTRKKLTNHSKRK